MKEKNCHTTGRSSAVARKGSLKEYFVRNCCRQTEIWSPRPQMVVARSTLQLWLQWVCSQGIVLERKEERKNEAQDHWRITHWLTACYLAILPLPYAQISIIIIRRKLVESFRSLLLNMQSFAKLQNRTAIGISILSL